MQAGLGHLRLSPRDFWSMTMPEFAAAIRGANGGAINDPLSTAALVALMEQFPDEKENGDVR